ncbi:MAG TPA: sterol carrier protein domain-containing protein, partial [Brevibacterium sp.]|nr:sterol carrier protein domain-containing protein [Brevibacterium sp.]
WLRILDVKKSLEARPYSVEGTLTLAVHDDMDYAEGVFRLTSDGESGTVERISESSDSAAGRDADLRLGVPELGSLYLGGADPVVLSRAGRISPRTEDAAIRARALLSLERAPYAPNDF